MTPEVQPVFFRDAAAFHAWLAAHHATATELHVGFYKKSSGRAGLTYAEAVDEALCFGWIDGIIRRIDDVRYQHRFTPRRPRSIWSKVNLAKVRRLQAAGRMQAAGLAAFAARTAARSGVYAFENRARSEKFPAPLEKQFRARRRAWAFFTAQAPWYRRTSIHFVLSARREDTRRRRLARLIADSAAGRRLGAMDRPAAK